MTQEEEDREIAYLEHYLSYVMTDFSRLVEKEILSIKVKTERDDSIFVPNTKSYLIEVKLK